MRHKKNTDKLGRTSAHRAAVIANVLASLVRHERISTTLRLAKSVQRYADRLITLAKRNTLHARRQAISALRPSGPEQKDAVRKLFNELGPRFAERTGGYTRIVKLPPRRGDAAPMAVLEFVGAQVTLKKKRERPAEELQVETQVVGDALPKAAEAAAPEHAERTAASVTEKPAPSAPAEDRPGAQEPGAVAPGKPEEPHGTDRKGGLGRFFKGLLGKDKKD